MAVFKFDWCLNTTNTLKIGRFWNLWHCNLMGWSAYKDAPGFAPKNSWHGFFKSLLRLCPVLLMIYFYPIFELKYSKKKPN